MGQLTGVLRTFLRRIFECFLPLAFGRGVLGVYEGKACISIEHLVLTHQQFGVFRLKLSIK